ncbi:hypothetical protein PDE_09252 [Penicillium oxalicum 114-2]|uniref:Uncharacterized protein n=1 Tax=Penicillium oxalicum (strain 114-2 / CGMCC 5302) TaxID=933388 RepID=S8B607_PENO1|nr:hypothetical protein PDE_09252 [Penicillium oxalicum 114-2]
MVNPNACLLALRTHGSTAELDVRNVEDSDWLVIVVDSPPNKTRRHYSAVDQIPNPS